MPIELTNFVGVVEAASLLGVNRLTIWRWMNDGKMDYLMVAGTRYIPKSEIDRLLAGGKQEAVAEATTTA